MKHKKINFSLALKILYYVSSLLVAGLFGAALYSGRVYLIIRIRERLTSEENPILICRAEWNSKTIEFNLNKIK